MYVCVCVFLLFLSKALVSKEAAGAEGVASQEPVDVAAGAPRRLVLLQRVARAAREGERREAMHFVLHEDR